MPVTLSPVVTRFELSRQRRQDGRSAAPRRGSLTAGNTSLTYNASATLLAVQTFDSYGGGQSIVQTWRITGTGGITGSHQHDRGGLVDSRDAEGVGELLRRVRDGQHVRRTQLPGQRDDQ